MLAKTKLKESSNEKGKDQGNGESGRIAAIKELIKRKRVNESDEDVPRATRATMTEKITTKRNACFA